MIIRYTKNHVNHRFDNHPSCAETYRIHDYGHQYCVLKWCYDGKYHREDGPAFIRDGGNGYKSYYTNGEFHGGVLNYSGVLNYN
jgi:hypothetical protein